MPYPGVQNDECLFGDSLYGPVESLMQIQVFNRDLVLMLMSYLGALKTWVYAGVFWLWPPSVASLRWPTLIVGGLTLVLAGALLRRAAGRRAGLFLAALLATDTIFLLTTVFDWGPVAFQRLFAVSAMLLTLRFHQTRSRAALFGGFACLGLGMWDKALFSWILGGMVVATIIVFPREVKASFSFRNLGIAVLGGLLGALPLIIYNVRSDFETFRANTNFSIAGLEGKIAVLRATLDGSGLFGYLVNDEWVEPIRRPRPGLERMLVTLQQRLGGRRTNLLPWALVLSLAAVPLWWRHRRAVLFAILASTVAWLQMAVTENAGGAVHHTTLLWPLPLWIIAIALAGLSEGPPWRVWLAGVVGLVLCVTNLRVTNQYYTQFVRNGPAPVWSDANTRLMYAALPKADLIVMDWGMMYSLRTFHKGQLRLWNGVDPVLDENVTDDDRAAIRRMVELPGAVFIGHTKPFEVNKGATDRLLRQAAGMGYAPQTLQTIWDSNGRPVFEVYRFVSAGR